MKTMLITGASRGLGLELVKQYASEHWQVIACCRQPGQANDLTALAEQYPSISIEQVDILQEVDIQCLAEKYKQQPVDLLFMNAGAYGPKGYGFDDISTEEWLNVLHVNSVAPFIFIKYFLKQVIQSELKQIALMSSKMGSIADNGSGGSYIYRSSKAALNAAAKSLAIDLAGDNVKVAIIHPGWVKTRMGGPNALIDTQTSIKGIKQLLENLSLENTGSFVAYDGQLIPW
ncbi:SDR family oxidoreductase [Zooshikella ganghwensis]|uniref:SDR family NAD(P)-dependent oxidoreductase n=1 Tax=Zooshikella ganghwensis TaxID=202772 RepID=A0A4P9VLG9_9GAMM|nr:SDR family oxidoreductase [Zooshikella ganghwensis]RDH42960.1 SDR family NAD(P)-dependent oxidoreductase [Zooshikella ganghwensis]